jgi:uncharacterized protein (TIGR02145 family)
MKKLVTLFLAIVSTYFLFAQAPQKMSYQAVIRNAQNELVISKPIKMRISILQGSTNGTNVYSELHNPSTNANGLVSIEIGSGTSPVGTIGSINWGNGTYFLKTETDPTNGTNYSIEGTSQLLSVPYALQANNAGNGFNRVSATGDTLFLENGKSVIIPGISSANNTNTPGTVTDASGNTYPTVTIGTQVWMAENLRTTKYQDGSNIPIVTDNIQWSNNYSFQQPMMCWYNNDSATYSANRFGALYNWYVVNPSANGNKNVCPTGWHVPTDAEWNILIKYLDPAADTTCLVCTQSSISGGSMKSTGTLFWESPNTGATNISGFTGLPAGIRGSAPFREIGRYTYWWSSTPSNNGGGLAWIRRLYYQDGTAFRTYPNSNSSGFSVRCLRD